jgi:predicted metal-binding protein
MTKQELIDAALAEGFAAAAVVDTSEIPFDAGFRIYCEENLCGQYGVNHSCPPLCGSFFDMKQRVQARKHAVVLQTIWEISDYSDKVAIKEAKGMHNRTSLALMEKLRGEGCEGFMVGASGCALCNPCSALDGAPCRLPHLQYSCMSAYCIFVSKLCAKCGLEYDCGNGLLAFFGMYVCD